MSPRLRSELRLRLGPRGCVAGLWARGWSGRPVAALSMGGESAPAALQAALQALRDAGHALPRAALLVLEDECLYHALLPLQGRWRDAPALARAHFAQALGEAGLHVALRLAPGGRGWLAAAVEADWLQALQDVLAQEGVALRSLRPALGEDLWRRRAELPRGDGVLALLRQQGLQLLALRAGALEQLSWERCAVDEPGTVQARVRAFSARLGLEDAGACVLPVDAWQHARLQPLAQAQGWRLLPVNPPPPFVAPAAATV